MYFILSKLLLYFIYPVIWIFVLLLIAILAKNQKRRLRLMIIAAVVLYIFSNQYLLGQFEGIWDYPPVSSNGQPAVYSSAIVLGGFTSIDKNGKGYFNEAADRFIQAIRLLATGKVKHILITGGNGDLLPGKYREADWVKSQLRQFKVPDSAILIEDHSRNTIENARFSKKVLDSARLKPPYLLVTSAFHMRRAMMIFKKQGYNIAPYPCNYLGGDGKFSIDNLIPDAGPMVGWEYYLKEAVGYVVDRFK